MKNFLLAQFDFHQRLFNNVLEDFSDAESNERPHGDTRMNHVKYLAGHLLSTQYGLALLAGARVQPRWQELFAPRGETRARDDIAYPTLDEIRAEWNGMYREVHDRFDRLSDTDLADTAPEPLGRFFEGNPDFGNTLAGVWAFLNHHQAYHIGQIAILRKGFGKEPMRYD